MTDNGVQLAYALEKGAKKLMASDKTELVITFKPLGGIRQVYGVTLEASDSAEHPYLTVGGRKHGSTTYHNRFVYVPRKLQITKTNASTRIVMRKNAGRIEVVELR